MNAQNLMRASAEFGDYLAELKAAYEVAVKSGNQFAELALRQMVEKSEQLHRELGKIIDAAILTQHNMEEAGE